MSGKSKNSFEVINDEIHIYGENWSRVGLTTYRKDYYDEICSKTWSLTNRKDLDKSYLKNSDLGLLHRYIMSKWYGKKILDEMSEKGYIVEHMNNKHMDCRISNLEFLKKAYNTAKAQTFDKDSVEMEKHIAVNIFKDFSTGCYQLTIGCNDSIIGFDTEGSKYYVVAILLLYNLKNIEIFLKGESDIYPCINFLPKPEKDVTSLTVFSELKINESINIPICLSLSPNWRY